MGYGIYHFYLRSSEFHTQEINSSDLWSGPASWCCIQRHAHLWVWGKSHWQQMLQRSGGERSCGGSNKSMSLLSGYNKASTYITYTHMLYINRSTYTSCVHAWVGVRCLHTWKVEFDVRFFLYQCLPYSFIYILYLESWFLTELGVWQLPRLSDQWSLWIHLYLWPPSAGVALICCLAQLLCGSRESELRAPRACEAGAELPPQPHGSLLCYHPSCAQRDLPQNSEQRGQCGDQRTHLKHWHVCKAI